MCGIFGYVGEPRVDLRSYLLQGLKEIEYRGYDSAGIVTAQDNKLNVIKGVGAPTSLKLRGARPVSSALGLGHTRWATHGGVTKKNAHPHLDCKGNVAVVHNGIIENYEILRDELIRGGHKFRSDTDTEVVAHLVEDNLRKRKSLEEAVRGAFLKLDGMNAIVVIDKNGEQIVGFREGSPLVVGILDNGYIVGSDTSQLSKFCRFGILIDDMQGFVLTLREVKVIAAKTGKATAIKRIKLEKAASDTEVGKFKHFMLKEINEQPEVIARIANIKKREINKASAMIKSAWGTYFTACGTAAYAGLAATYMFSEIASRHVNFAVGSEFYYLENFLVPESLLIAASQSGETMDTLLSVRAAKRHGSQVLAVVNTRGSSLDRQADSTLYLRAQVERAVVSTKAYVAKLAMFYLLAQSIAGQYDQGVHVLKKTSKLLSEYLKSKNLAKIKRLAMKLKDENHIYLIGRGVNYATALEGALKIKESSYIHAEGFAGGELKHGVIALIEKGTPVIAIVADDQARESVVSNAIEVKSRGAYVIGVSPRNEKAFDYWIPVPDGSAVSAIVNVVPLQILAYYLALARGLNPDKPRNLAKSVTVK